MLGRADQGPAQLSLGPLTHDGEPATAPEGVTRLDIQDTKRATDSYLESVTGATAERLRFFEGLWEIQSEIGAVDRPFAAPVADAALEALATGRPLFLVSRPVVPMQDYVDTVERVAAHVARSAGLPDGQAAALLAAPFREAITEGALENAVPDIDAFVAGVTARLNGGGTGLTDATLAFVLLSALSPFLHGPAREAWSVVDEGQRRTWRSGHCPICGSAAAIGRVGERGDAGGAERGLWCGTCGTEWHFDRIRCVRCGTRNPDVLRYSYEESDPAHRVHLCDECHGYAKFVIEDEMRRPISMQVEDAVTGTLDAIARSQGYTPTGDRVLEAAAGN